MEVEGRQPESQVKHSHVCSLLAARDVPNRSEERRLYSGASKPSVTMTLTEDELTFYCKKDICTYQGCALAEPGGPWRP